MTTRRSPALDRTRRQASLAALAALAVFSAGCGGAGDEPPRSVPVSHLAACVEAAPAQPCERVPGYDPDYWVAEQADRTGTYLDAAGLCLGALLDGHVVGRRGACADVYDAYVADARSGRRDLDGRLDEAQARRAFGLAYSAMVARRTRDVGEAMTTSGRDYNSGSFFGTDTTAPR